MIVRRLVHIGNEGTGTFPFSSPIALSCSFCAGGIDSISLISFSMSFQFDANVQRNWFREARRGEVESDAGQYNLGHT